MDTEIVHALAPDAAIREVLIPSPDTASSDKVAAALAAAMRLGLAQHPDVMALSIGAGEQCFAPAVTAQINSVLQTAQRDRVTVVAGTGDSGAATTACPGPGTGTGSAGVKGADFPASDPFALAAGGTSLQASRATGAYIGETAWNVPPAAGGPAASGGGFSRLFRRPAYQDGIADVGATRGLPDVSADADTHAGMALDFSEGGKDQFIGAGGGSAAVPLWAAVIALADQYARPLHQPVKLLLTFACGRSAGESLTLPALPLAPCSLARNVGAGWKDRVAEPLEEPLLVLRGRPLRAMAGEFLIDLGGKQRRDLIGRPADRQVGPQSPDRVQPRAHPRDTFPVAPLALLVGKANLLVRGGAFPERGDDVAATLQDLAPKPRGEPQDRERVVSLLDLVPERRRIGLLADGVSEGQQDALLRAKRGVNRLHRDAGFLGDRPDRGPGESLPVEQHPGGVEDRRPGHRGVTRPQRRRRILLERRSRFRHRSQLTGLTSHSLEQHTSE